MPLRYMCRSVNDVSNHGSQSMCFNLIIGYCLVTIVCDRNVYLVIISVEFPGAEPPLVVFCFVL